MDLASAIIYAGGKGSGCNPKAGVCGRPPGGRSSRLVKVANNLLAKKDAIIKLLQHPDPLIRQFGTLLSKWHDRGFKSTRDKYREWLETGKADDLTKLFINTVANGPKQPPLTRALGIESNSKFNKFVDTYKPGTEFDMPAWSFSKGKPPLFGNVEIKTKGATGLDMKNIVSSDYMTAQEREVIVGGKFRVDKVEHVTTDRGYHRVMITVTQIGKHKA